MKTFTKIILASTAGVALVGAAAVAIAHDGQRGYGKGNGQYGMMMGGGPRRMAQLDTDNDDKISLDEFLAPIQTRFTEADADSDGAVTTEEVQAMIRAQMAERMMSRMDANEDGKITLDELTNRPGKRFALADDNNDGFISTDEMRELRGRGGRGGRGGHGEGRGHRGGRHGGWGWFGGGDDNQ